MKTQNWHMSVFNIFDILLALVILFFGFYMFLFTPWVQKYFLLLELRLKKRHFWVSATETTKVGVKSFLSSPQLLSITSIKNLYTCIVYLYLVLSQQTIKWDLPPCLKVPVQTLLCTIKLSLNFLATINSE